MERKYQMTRVRSGDYLFPSNDGTRLWRLNRYYEDGSLETFDGTKIVGYFWQACRFDGTLEEADKLLKADVDELLGWTRWQMWGGLLRTRKEAEAVALQTQEEALVGGGG